MLAIGLLMVCSLCCGPSKVTSTFLLRFFSCGIMPLNVPCDFCPATCFGAGDRNFDEGLRASIFKKNAKWERQVFSASQWRNLMQESMHCIFRIPFISGLNVDPDELHVVHLGCNSYMLGSVLWLLCFRILKGRPSENMSRVWSLIARPYLVCCPPTQY